MATTRTLSSRTTGYARLALDITAGQVDIATSPHNDDSEIRIVLHTDDDTGPVADAIRSATLGMTKDGATTLSVHTPAVTISNVSRSGYTTTIESMTIAGSVTFGHGGFFFAGQPSATRLPSGLMVTVHMPQRGAVQFVGKHACLRTSGWLRAIAARIVNGDIRVAGADLVEASVTNGDVTVNESGAMHCHATTTNGDVTVVAKSTGPVHATTTNGDVTVYRTPGVNTPVTAYTRNGSRQVIG